MSRREFHREYYWRTVERRRLLALHRKHRRRWIPWLLAELRIEAEPENARELAVPYPIRRPTLRLRSI